MVIAELNGFLWFSHKKYTKYIKNTISELVKQYKSVLIRIKWSAWDEWGDRNEVAHALQSLVYI